jgi:dTDP-4-amino-4,6-dideoxygalactose transaminase
MKVPFLDLSVSDISLRKKLLIRINKILRTGKILEGKEQREFEKIFAKELGAKYAVGVSSGSSALFLALKASGVGAGDEVITTPFTWIITINAITSVGAIPKFVDIDQNFNLDIKKIESAITKKTKAIVPVHIGGKLCEMEKIYKLALKYKLKVVEDAAQAFFSADKNKRAGAYSHASAFSFNPMKTLHAYGEAGAVVTDNKKIYKILLEMRHAGTTRKKKNFDINNCNYVSLNHKIDTMQASMLIENLKRKKEIINKRNKISKLYDKSLKGLAEIQQLKKNETHGRYLYLARFKKRNLLQKFLRSKKIETKVFYSPLACDAPVYKKKIIMVPKSRKYLKESLALPLHEKMKISQVNYVLKNIQKFYGK